MLLLGKQEVMAVQCTLYIPILRRGMRAPLLVVAAGGAFLRRQSWAVSSSRAPPRSFRTRNATTFYANFIVELLL